MKNNNKPDLEQLLDDLGHAGRDSRRRDDLAAMIDNMAAAESRRHGFWWWSTRVAAAACVLFFISTAVRVWFIPTTVQQDIMVAKTETPHGTRAALPANDGAEDAIPTPSPLRPRSVSAPSQPAPKPVSDTLAEPIAEAPLMEEYFAEEIPDTLPAAPDTVAATPIEAIAQPVVSLAIAEPDPTPEPQAEPRRRSLLASLLRQPEPDDMTGVVLAFRIL